MLQSTNKASADQNNKEDKNWRKDSARTTNKSTLGEAMGRRGGGKEEEQRVEEEAGGHTMWGCGRCRFRCRPAEGRGLVGWKGSAVGRLVDALFCSVAGCLLALGTAVDSDGAPFFPFPALFRCVIDCFVAVDSDVAPFFPPHCRPPWPMKFRASGGL